jgi:hypothetical protein
VQNSDLGGSLVIINKIQTTLDGGARVTLDLPSVSSELIGALLHRKLMGNEQVFAQFVEVEE